LNGLYWLGGTMRARAVDRELRGEWNGDAGEGPCGVEHRENFCVNHPVIDIPAVTAVLDDASVAQYRQLLRNGCLPKTKIGFQMANAMLAIPQQFQNADAAGMVKDFEDLSRVIQLANGNHIQIHEYDCSAQNMGLEPQYVT